MAVEMLSGKLPLEGFTPVGIMSFHRSSKRPEYKLPDNVLPECEVVTVNSLLNHKLTS